MEVEAARQHDAHEWKTQVNKENFNTMVEVEQMWKRTERLVQSLNVPEEQKEVKKLALEGITKGKEIVHKRAKLI